jgi:hypothetical protein
VDDVSIVGLSLGESLVEPIGLQCPRSPARGYAGLQPAAAPL